MSNFTIEEDVLISWFTAINVTQKLHSFALTISSVSGLKNDFLEENYTLVDCNIKEISGTERVWDFANELSRNKRLKQAARFKNTRTL